MPGEDEHDRFLDDIVVHAASLVTLQDEVRRPASDHASALMHMHEEQAASILAGSVTSCAIRALSQEDGGVEVINLLELWPSLTSSEPQSTSAFSLAASTWQQLRSFAAAHGWQTLYAAFLRQQYSNWASAVLTVAEENESTGTSAADVPPAAAAAAAAAGCASRATSVREAAAATLRQAPASAALVALTEHLSTVQPLPGTSYSHAAASRISLIPASAHLALKLLSERFAAPGSPGVVQVLLQCLPTSTVHTVAAAAAASTPEGLAAAALTSEGIAAAAAAAAAAQLQAFHLQLSAAEAGEAAAVLASVPDRVQHLSSHDRDLQQPQYTCTILLQALTGLQWVLDLVKEQPDGTTDSSSSSSSRTPVECAVAVSCVVELVHRCIRRGQAAAVACVLWRLTAPDTPLLHVPVTAVKGESPEATAAAAAAAVPAACGGCKDSTALADASGREALSSASPPAPAAAARSGVVVADSTLTLVLQGLSQHGISLERLLGQLLVLAGAPGVTTTTSSSSSSSNQPGVMQQSAASSSSSSQPGVMQQLIRLLHPLLSQQGAADYLVSDRLLLQRTLPLDALYCLIHLLYACRPVLLVKAAQRLAASWGEGHTIATTTVSQQAFMTAALVAALQQLPAHCLDPSVTPGDTSDVTQGRSSTVGVGQQPVDADLVREAVGLVPAILSGVSTRLGSPLPALRRQGMRVGQALAARLDPGKDLFGDQDLGVQPEEAWPGMSLQKVPPGLTAAAAAVEAALASCKQTPGSSSGSSGDAMAGQANGYCSSTQSPRHPPAAAVGGGSSSSDMTTDGVPSQQQQQQQQLEEASFSLEPKKGLTSGRDSALAKALEEAEEPDSDDAEDGPPWSTVDPVNDTATPSGQPKVPPVAVPVGTWGGGRGAESDSDSDWGEDWGAGAVAEDAAAEEWWAADGLGLPEGKPLSLRALAAALRKQDDVTTVLDAVGRAEVLIRAAPDELAAHGPELARALLHCRVPEWANTEASSPEAQPAQQRARALTALLVGAPESAGDQVLSEVYSQHLDQYQRLLILDSLSAAAQELADERSGPQLVAAPGAAPQLLPPATTTSKALPTTSAAAAAGGGGSASHMEVGGGSSSPGNGQLAAGGGTRAAPGLRQVSSRVWGPVSLAKQREAGLKTFRNRFGPIALRWATSLLKNCDRPSPGIDLFGARDALLLGRLLSVLGTFAASAADTPAALPLAAGVLELVRAPAVHGHPQVFVRRNALAAAAQVLSHLPAPRVAAALLGHQRDAGDALLQERLAWLQGWAAGVAQGDSDEPCRMLAAGCCALQGQLAEEALKSMEQLPEAMSGLGQGQRLGGGRGGGGSGGVQVHVPSLTGLRLS